MKIVINKRRVMISPCSKGSLRSASSHMARFAPHHEAFTRERCFACAEISILNERPTGLRLPSVICFDLLARSSGRGLERFTRGYGVFRLAAPLAGRGLRCARHQPQ